LPKAVIDGTITKSRLAAVVTANDTLFEKATIFHETVLCIIFTICRCVSAPYETLLVHTVT